jgi:hypothetical protein
MIRGVLRRLFSVQALHIYEMKMEGEANPPWKSDNAKVFRLEKDFAVRFVQEANRLADGWVTFTVENVNARIDDGELCFCASDNDSLVAFAWFAPKSLTSHTFAVRMVGDDNVVFGYNSYVSKKVRGKNIIVQIYRVAVTEMLKEDLNRWVVYVLPTNVSSLKSLKRFRPERIGKIYCIVVGGVSLQISRILKPGVKIERQGDRFIAWQGIFKKALTDGCFAQKKYS